MKEAFPLAFGTKRLVQNLISRTIAPVPKSRGDRG